QPVYFNPSSATSIPTTSRFGVQLSGVSPLLRQYFPPCTDLAAHSVNKLAFARRARDPALVPSMGSISDCYGNAVIESFWGRTQTEILHRKRWKTRFELANAMVEYLDPTGGSGQDR
ncbi:hypothetical protein QNA26_33025, partial [Rhodococcus qingshengii]|nr:hypothetical protein [Rhodococcus qingshengii]